MNEFCPLCGRLLNIPCESARVAQYVYYVHEWYGCDSGCCGYRLYVMVENGSLMGAGFEFEHDKELLNEWAKEVAHHLNAVVDWSRCVFEVYC